MKKISLNGLWKFVPELDPKYHFDRLERLERMPPYSNPEFDRSNWETVKVPGVWQKYAERYDIFEGVCWFCREFEVDRRPENVPVRIRFGAVNYFCVVYLNGKEAGRHEGGYTEFLIDATNLIKAGENHIAVRVDNRSSIIKWPPCIGYFNYGGIHRDVTLEIADQPSFDEVFCHAEPAQGGGKLNLRGKILLYEPGLTVKVECSGKSISCNVLPDAAFSIQVSIDGAIPWTPENPTLYPLSVKLILDGNIIDTCNRFCGFRKIEAKNKKIFLNGKKYSLNGICYVYDSPVHGLYMDRETIEKDILLIKETGASAVRTHYPMDKVFYEICDRRGLLVWIEPPIYCYHPQDDEKHTCYSDSKWMELAKQMLREMIANSSNHPSVAIYGIGNECNLKNPEAFQFFKELADTIRLQDTGRLISYAALYGNIGKLAEIVDILGVNSYWGWYDKIFGGKGLQPEAALGSEKMNLKLEPIDLSKMKEMLEEVISSNHENPLFLTEFGADSVKGYMSGSRDLWSENYHAALLLEILKLASEYPEIAGTFPFCFSDYRDPSKVVNAYWNEMNLKGIADYHRNKKLSFESLVLKYKQKI